MRIGIPDVIFFDIEIGNTIRHTSKTQRNQHPDLHNAGHLLRDERKNSKAAGRKYQASNTQ
jgi:Tol biopolymer transport system component